MNILKIDIQKSLNFEKLYFHKSLFVKIWEHILIIINILFFLYITGMNLYDDRLNSEPYGWSLFLFVFMIIIAYAAYYLSSKSNSLEKIEGISEIINTKIVKEITENNKWRIHSDEKGLDIINVSFLDTQTDYGKQIVILYNGNDVLVNCISFALGKTPNPFNWFSNKRMEKQFRVEFYKLKKRITTTPIK